MARRRKQQSSAGCGLVIIAVLIMAGIGACLNAIDGDDPPERTPTPARTQVTVRRTPTPTRAIQQFAAPLNSACDRNYDPCVPVYPPDVDCKDLRGSVRVIGVDVHRLDRDGDGVGCE